MNPYSTTYKIIGCALLICTMTINAISQQVSVIQYEGDAFTYNSNEEKVMYKKIVFGPLPEADKILLKSNSNLKLINEENEVCELSSEGEYSIENLKFEQPSSNSLFDKFCSYFHSFFVNHSSAESKSSYKNSIHAISRGELSPPQLDFPIDGLLPSTSEDIEFSWSHSCESCQYVVTIYDLETRASVYAWTTESQSVILQTANQFLTAGKKYYWTVTISGQEMEYPISRISIGKEGEYESLISNIEKEISASNLKLNEATQAIYVMSLLEDQGLINYAIYYGQKSISRYPDNKVLSDFVERFWYDTLIEIGN